jgi:hypothetical protein
MRPLLHAARAAAGLLVAGCLGSQPDTGPGASPVPESARRLAGAAP